MLFIYLIRVYSSSSDKVLASSSSSVCVFLVFLDFILLVEDLFFGNLSTTSDLILLYNCPYKLSYILSDSLLINSLNWSLDIVITGEEEVVEEEEGIEEVVEEEEGIEEEGIKGIEGIEEIKGIEGIEGIEEESKTSSDEESQTLSDDVNPNSDSDNGL